jgi:hypothetical protein
VSLLRQIEVAVANGKTTPIACREGGKVSELSLEKLVLKDIASGNF